MPATDSGADALRDNVTADQVWAAMTEATRYRCLDYLIAATALVIDAELLTTNVRLFPMFTKLNRPL